MVSIARMALMSALAGLALDEARAEAGGGAHSHATSHADAHYSAGVPGDPDKPARIVHIVMREADGKMLFVPNRIEVRKGEQIRFTLRNVGALEHEFVLASKAENRKHAEAMQKHPDMEHEDENMTKLEPQRSTELIWRFTKAGTFEYGCLIPGHYEAGMYGTVVVK